jgi:mycothiol S-conjugate amidase
VHGVSRELVSPEPLASRRMDQGQPHIDQQAPAQDNGALGSDPSRRCILFVHAHPDDESSKAAGTVALYSSRGVRCVLVTCTGGEEGDILNPAMDTPEVRANLPELRRRELEKAVSILGFQRLVWLGYRDSGMPGSEANKHPESLASAPLEEATGRLVGVIREERPQVVVAYPENQQGYPHPDHLRVYEVAKAAFEAAGDPARYLDAGPPWQPLKLYATGVWSPGRLRAMLARAEELGLEIPGDPKWVERIRSMANEPDTTTTRIDVTGFEEKKREALKAHATQIDPNSTFWFSRLVQETQGAYPWEDFELIAVAKGFEHLLARPKGIFEHDLFEGI